MQRLEVSGAVRLIYESGVKGLTAILILSCYPRLCLLCDPDLSGQNYIYIYIYMYISFLPRALHFRQCHLLWDNHPKIRFDAARFENFVEDI